jgi:hypothetical protein
MRKIPRGISGQRLRQALRLKGSEKLNEGLWGNCVILFELRNHFAIVLPKILLISSWPLRRLGRG